MIKKIWKKVKFAPNYLVSNYGEVYSLYSKKNLKPFKTNNGSLRVRVRRTLFSRTIALHNLVFTHFKNSQLTRYKELVMHLDYNKENNISTNLDKYKHGDVLRMWNEYRNRVRGVYRFKIRQRGYSYDKWRAVVKYKGKTKTLGYFNTKQEAFSAYYDGYKLLYGREPFKFEQGL